MDYGWRRQIHQRMKAMTDNLQERAREREGEMYVVCVVCGTGS